MRSLSASTAESLLSFAWGIQIPPHYYRTHAIILAIIISNGMWHFVRYGYLIGVPISRRWTQIIYTEGWRFLPIPFLSRARGSEVNQTGLWDYTVKQLLTSLYTAESAIASMLGCFRANVGLPEGEIHADSLPIVPTFHIPLASYATAAEWVQRW